MSQQADIYLEITFLVLEENLSLDYGKSLNDNMKTHITILPCTLNMTHVNSFAKKLHAHSADTVQVKFNGCAN